MRSNKGFGLIEIMVVVAVVGVLAALSGTMVEQYLLNTKIRATAEVLKEAVVLSRAEAVKRNDTVKLTVLGGGGWIMQGYVNNVLTTLKSKVDMTGSQWAVTPANSVIRFNGSGRADVDLALNIKPTTSSGSCSAVTCLRIEITKVGKVRVCNPSSTNEVLQCG